MKRNVLNTLCLSMITMAAVTANGAAAPGACSTEKSSAVSKACRAELVRTMNKDRVTSNLRTALERSYPLRACEKIKPGTLKVNYVSSDAVGPTLEVASFIGCTSDDGADGYTITGEYFIDGGGYGFKSITLSTFE